MIEAAVAAAPAPVPVLPRLAFPATWRLQLARQIEHWATATDTLVDMGVLASPASWEELDRYLGTQVEATLQQAVEGLRKQCRVLRVTLEAIETQAELRALQRALLAFRRRFLAVETVLNFYGDAINTRTNPKLGAYLRGCDFLAEESLRRLLEPLGHRPPPILCYLEIGLGASVLRPYQRLWDGRSLSPVAAIKMVRHNYYRQTSLIHETGHVGAHALGWVDELADALGGIKARSDVAGMWSGWASEIAADAFAFVHTGYAALAALHDVLAGEASWVMRVDGGDPHPSGYIRILLGWAMCRSFFGQGPWDDLADSWRNTYAPRVGTVGLDDALQASVPLLPEIVAVILERRYRAFGGKALTSIIDPARVKPEALFALERDAGRALYQSSDWLRREALRVLALNGYRVAVEPARMVEIFTAQDEWMRRLGDQRREAKGTA